MALELASLPTHHSATNRNFGHTSDAHALEHIEVDGVMVSLGRNYTRCIAVPNDDVSIAADSNGAFLWKNVEDLSSVSTRCSYELLGCHETCSNTIAPDN